MSGLSGHGPACGDDACMTCYLDAERDRLAAENERLRGEVAALTKRMAATEQPCGCAATCGDDGDIDGPGTCKGLPMCREPLVEVVLVPRRRGM